VVRKKGVLTVLECIERFKLLFFLFRERRQLKDIINRLKVQHHHFVSAKMIQDQLYVLNPFVELVAIKTEKNVFTRSSVYSFY